MGDRSETCIICVTVARVCVLFSALVHQYEVELSRNTQEQNREACTRSDSLEFSSDA